MNKPTFQMQEIEDLFKASFGECYKGLDNTYHSFLNLVRSHLENIYGEKASWKRILKEYEMSHMLEHTHVVNSIDDLPELTEDDLRSFRCEEKAYAETLSEISKIWDVYSAHDQGENDLAFYKKWLNLVGLVPDSSQNSIFKFLAKNITVDNFHKISSDARKKLQIVLNLCTKICLSGFTLDFNCLGTVVTQLRSRNYYRGENAFYGSSKPSLYRKQGNKKTEFDILIDKIRLFECWNFFDQFDVVKKWGVSAVNYMALSQHYGYPTAMMDVTSDLDTALFFACCKYEDKIWKPLTSSDFAKKDSRQYVADNGGDSRYAVFYVADRETMDIRFALGDGNIHSGIIPIGYQPLMRCSTQNGYMLWPNDKNYDLYKDKRFYKYKIRLSEKLCNDIYERMDGGNAVYPNFDIPDVEQYINTIKNTNTFTEYVVQNETEGIPIDKVRSEFKKHGYFIRRKNPYISNKRLKWINKNYTVEKVVDAVTILPISLPMFMI